MVRYFKTIMVTVLPKRPITSLTPRILDGLLPL
jgi:hypothetical protein